MRLKRSCKAPVAAHREADPYRRVLMREKKRKMPYRLYTVMEVARYVACTMSSPCLRLSWKIRRGSGRLHPSARLIFECDEVMRSGRTNHLQIDLLSNVVVPRDWTRMDRARM